MSFGERMRAMPDRWRRRRAAKKRRLARMSRRRRVLRRIGITGTWLLAIVALFLGTTTVLFYTLTDVPRPENLPLQKTATILYSDGTVMARQYVKNRTVVPLSRVPEAVRWDVLAAEDRGFYSEPGVSIRGTARAALSDLTGGDTQGGSGITQQYVKNAYLNDSRSLTRKLKELMIAVKLSRQYGKDQILEFYLNTVYFGRGAYGIQAAAQTFFGRDVSQLTLAQGAVLAAQLRAPSYYDPANNPDAARARWKYVLDGMVSTGHLTKAAEDKLTYPRVRSARTAADNPSPTDFIVNQVLADLQAHGISQTEMYNKGLTITTTIDRRAQQAAENAIAQTFANLTPQQRNMKNALVAVNPSTGAVLAYYGGPNGKDYAGQADHFDYAGVGMRPAGSSFKPYTLATVLSQTLAQTPGTRPLTISSMVDGSYCTTIQGRRICNDPTDYSHSARLVSIADAMKYSLNTTFDELAVEVGPDNVAKTAHAAGVSKQATLADANGDTGFDIGIGGYPVHPIDQAVGFATFANRGVANPSYFVDKAVDSNGVVVYRHKATPTHAVDAKVANDVTVALRPVALWSNDPLAGGRESSAKTGTQGIPTPTGQPDRGNSDAWMVGYTPQVSTAVWVGSGDSTHAIHNSYGGAEYGSDLPGKTWKLFMDTYLAGQPNLPMANVQQIGNGVDLTTPTVSRTPSKSPSPSPTPTKKSPTLSPTPVTPTPSRTTPTPTATASPPSPQCGGLFQPTCPPSSP